MISFWAMARRRMVRKSRKFCRQMDSRRARSHTPVLAFAMAASALTLALAHAPVLAAQRAKTADRAATSTPAQHGSRLREHVKSDAKAVGIAFKETTHKVGVAAKAVGHEIATAAKRSAAATRSAMKGGEAVPPP